MSQQITGSLSYSLQAKELANLNICAVSTETSLLAKVDEGSDLDTTYQTQLNSRTSIADLMTKPNTSIILEITIPKVLFGEEYYGFCIHIVDVIQTDVK